MSPTYPPLIRATCLEGFEPLPVGPPVPDRRLGLADSHEGFHLPSDDAFEDFKLRFFIFGKLSCEIIFHQILLQKVAPEPGRGGFRLSNPGPRFAVGARLNLLQLADGYVREVNRIGIRLGGWG